MIEIIPAIDLIDGKCVRLSQGDYSKKTVYHENPLEVALRFEDAGIRRLHLVDLDGARKGQLVNLPVLESIAGQTSLKIDFGGGIKSNTDIQSVYDAGAAMATIGSLAVKNPDLFFSWVRKYGTEKILLGADVKNEMIAVSGWTEQTRVPVFDFIRKNLEAGVSNVFCTDISKDGMMKGPATELYSSLVREFSKNDRIHLVASGGISTIQDIHAVKEAGCSGVIIGKAIYEGAIPLEELKPFLP